jgi:hypothetical protein
VRLFPERILFAMENLTERETVAWLRLTMAYVTRDGHLPADDKTLSMITKSGKRWPELRAKLVMLGLARIGSGWWVDDDQDVNLEIQRGLSRRAIKANAKRWGERDA